MPNNRLAEFIKRLSNLEEKMTDHLIESGGIKNQLKVNTWLTGVVLIALVGKFLADFTK